jgi:ABC-type Mn2+/Zn2+ transport system permease subunit
MDPFFYLILVAGAIAGASCGLLGVYLVGLRLPFVGVFISHAAMTGTVYSLLLGLNPIWGPAAVSAVACRTLAGKTD